jgi:molybdopterin synthase catalytic subunit
MMIQVADVALSIDACVANVAGPECGGICIFLGTVRDNFEGHATDHLEYEAYAEMAEETIQAIAGEARGRWPIARVAVQHRTGTLQIGEVSVIVAVSAPHRAEAFEACRYVIDELKERAPIWKKEVGESGEIWVGAPTATD